jgi:hypothetical protein
MSCTHFPYHAESSLFIMSQHERHEMLLSTEEQADLAGWEAHKCLWGTDEKHAYYFFLAVFAACLGPFAYGSHTSTTRRSLATAPCLGARTVLTPP